jgi:hypothetical protein
MVCDFIKYYFSNYLIIYVYRDESGLWWFIGCRGFKVGGNNGKASLKYFI